MAASSPAVRLLCPLCSQGYDTPRLLPCEHSFCSGCLQTYIGSLGLVAGDKGFPCPVCTLTTPVPDNTAPVEEWASLFPLNRLFEALLQLPSPSKSSPTDALCDPCKMLQDTNHALYRCSNCSQFLCSSCESYHQRNRFTASHTVIPIERGNGPSAGVCVDIFCKSHPRKIINAFCREHKALCCSSCASSIHEGCSGMMSVDDVTTDSVSTVAETTQRKVNEIGTHVETLREIKEENIKTLDCENAKLLMVMKRIVDGAKSQLDDLLTDFQENLHLEWEENRQRLVSDLTHTEMFSVDLDNRCALVSGLRENSLTSQLFIAQEMVKAQVKSHVRNMRNILERDIDITEVDIDMNIAVLDEKSVSAIRNYGGVSVTEIKSPRTRTITKNLETNVKEMDAIIDLSIQEETAKLTERSVSRFVEMLGGKQAAKLTGGAYFPNGKCLMADQKHRRLLLFDQNYKIEKAMSIDKPPSDIVYSARHQSVFIAVGYYFDKDIYRYSFDNDSIEYQDKLKVPKGTWGISVIDDVILAGGPNSVEMISVDGTSLNSFPTNGVCTYVAACRRSNSFWFKDGDNVVCMKMDGTSGFRYQDKDLKGVSGIACDQFGNAYVCSRETGHVHQIFNDGTSGRILLKMQHNISRPNGIVFHPTRHEFVITSDGEPTAFEVYKFD
ncbi:protein PML-like [Mizuhopecten yessoensis]|uniref:Tripartite motif-containing protein 45 n=1 Tax=Mizuhopecten yessoensis TaxID=6573 RepID=A0A210PII3_MIZYE|nr:protein PML-like [Mizuhopecten yessoensis]OWF36297.1 Tripartite motif-containing protein 45 [Mizuhopecten yessoensis]